MVEQKKSVSKVKHPVIQSKKPPLTKKISKAIKPGATPTFSKIMEPPATKFKLRNILQAIVGATILAIPIGFTEETWKLGETLPTWNIIIIFLLSILFVGLFAYRHFKKNVLNFGWHDLIKRTSTIYIVSFIVVALILSIIQKAPWGSDIILSLKRTIIVTLPSALGATIAGSLK